MYVRWKIEGMRKLIKSRWVLPIICLLFVYFLAGIWLPTLYLFDPGLDAYEQPQQALFTMATRGYIRIQSEKSKLDAEEPVRLSVNTAFFDSLYDAQQADTLHIRAGGGEYLDVTVSCGDAVDLTVDDFDIAQLVYERKGLFERVTKNSLPFAFTIIAEVRPDAPAEFSGTIGCEVYVKQYVQDPQTGETVEVDMENPSRITVYFYRSGDRIYLSETSVEDAKARGKIIA